MLIPLLQLLPLLALAQAGVVSRDNDNSTTSPTTQAEVIIIGGGIAGISAARTLINDFNITSVILIEARGELGGRAHTEVLHGSDGTNWTVEKGCNWIQGPGKEPITALATKWNLSTAPTDYGDVVFFEGKAGVEGTAESGLRGSFLTEDESLEFTAGYDNFLDNAGGYSGGCCTSFTGVLETDDSMATEQLIGGPLCEGRNVHHGLDPGHAHANALRILERRLHICPTARGGFVRECIRTGDRRCQYARPRPIRH